MQIALKANLLFSEVQYRMNNGKHLYHLKNKPSSLYFELNKVLRNYASRCSLFAPLRGAIASNHPALHAPYYSLMLGLPYLAYQLPNYFTLGIHACVSLLERLSELQKGAQRVFAMSESANKEQRDA